jgi:hypothetical protein
MICPDCGTEHDISDGVRHVVNDECRRTIKAQRDKARGALEINKNLLLQFMEMVRQDSACMEKRVWLAEKQLAIAKFTLGRLMREPGPVGLLATETVADIEAVKP